MFPLVVGWNSQLMGWVGLDRVTQNGPVDNSDCCSVGKLYNKSTTNLDNGVSA